MTYGYSPIQVWSRQLDVAAAASVEEALRGFVAWEKMEGPDSWCCSACSARHCMYWMPQSYVMEAVTVCRCCSACSARRSAKGTHFDPNLSLP